MKKIAPLITSFYNKTNSTCKTITKSILVVIILIITTSNLKSQDIPNPYQIASTTQFDYSAYLKLMEMNDDFVDSQWERSYFELLAILESRYGNYIYANKIMDNYFSKSNITLEPPYFSDIALIPMSSCVDSLVAVNRVVMINETHFDPIYRTVAQGFLKLCYKHGYCYLAIETLKETDTLLNERKYPILFETGFYCDEPLYGDLIRQALKMGFTLVPYEWDFKTGTSREEGVPIDQIKYSGTDKEVVLVLYPGKYLLRFDDGKNKKTKVITVE